MAIGELYFPGADLKVYAGGVRGAMYSLTLVALGLAMLAFKPWNARDALFIVSSISVAVLGAGLTFLFWLIYVAGTLMTWRAFRQLRPPGVIIDATGVRYLASRRPVFIPWSDIEQVGLERTISRDIVRSQVFIRLTPGAALLSDEPFTVPYDRVVKIGFLSRLSVSEDAALRFLEKTSGSPLETTGVAHRTLTIDRSWY